MSITKKNAELARLGRYIARKPDDHKRIKKYAQLQGELSDFDAKVRRVLEAHFRPENHRSIVAILNAIPSGNLSYIFTAWLDELAGLKLITVEQASQSKAAFNV